MNLLYRSGDLFLPKNIRKFLETYIVGNDKSYYYISYWTIAHLISGILTYYLITVNPINALLFHTAWELWQIFIGMTILDTRGIIDIANDTLFFMCGFYISKIMNMNSDL